MQHRKAELFDRIMRFICDYESSNRGGPSQREIASSVGLSNSTVCGYLSDLAERGLVVFDNRRHVLSAERMNALEDMNVTPYGTGVPVLGSVACGQMKDAEEQFEESVSLPRSIFGNGDLFILHADGDSMVEAGIDDGDLVVIRRQRTADPGQIVVAYTEGTTTLKGFFPEPEKRRIRLQPANSLMEPIYVSEVEIQGVALFVIKELGPMRVRMRDGR